MTIYHLSLFDHDVLPAPLQPVIMALHTACDMVDNAKATFHRTLASYTSFFTDMLVPKMAPPPEKAAFMRSQHAHRFSPFVRVPPRVTPRVVPRASVVVAAVAVAAAATAHSAPRVNPVVHPAADNSIAQAGNRDPSPTASMTQTPRPSTEPELVVFGPPTVFQSSSHYENDILHYATVRRESLHYSYPRATSRLAVRIEEVIDRITATTESMFVRPNGLLLL